MVEKHSGYIDGQLLDDVRSLNTGDLLYALVNSVKTLAERVEALEAQIAQQPSA